ncbi:MAG: efflux RND transporter permease subunit, partial [Spirochaetaceae bacterium]|nr:efflux RND transporter permease subunit [Spirochaetaceae bacterium]
MEDLTSVLLKRRVATLVFVGIFLVIGFIALSQVPIAFYPRTSKPTITLDVSVTGHSAEDLFDSYAGILDNVARQVDAAERISAEFQGNRIRYRFEFPWGYDVDEARNRVFAVAPRFDAAFPTDSAASFGRATVSGGNDNSAGFMSVALYSSVLEHNELYYEARDILTSRFNEEVGDADIITISPVQILRADVTFDNELMLALNFNPQTVVTAVNNRFRNQAMGNFSHIGRPHTLRYVADADTIFQVGNVVVGNVGGSDIRLNDIAEVNVRYDLPNAIFRANGEQAIFIVAVPNPDGNIRTMSLEIENIIQESLQYFSEEVSFEIFVDPVEFIDNAIFSVVQAAILGSILIVLITLIFLGMPKNSLIVISAIPISLLFAFIFIRLFNVSINLISLSGLAISIGLTIDASIVIMENIHRHRVNSLRDNDGRSIYTILVQSISEVRLSVLASVLTSVCVFLPLYFTAPLANAILGDLAFTVVFMLLASLVASFTAVPVIAYYLFRSGHRKHAVQPEPKWNIFTAISNGMENFSKRLMTRLTAIYSWLLYKLLKNLPVRIGFIVVAIALLAASLIFIMPQIPSEIMPTPASNKIFVHANNNQLGSENAGDFLDAFEPIEDQILALVGDRLVNRFFQTRGAAAGSLLITISSSNDTLALIDQLNNELEAENWSFNIQQWDPASMPLPFTWDFQMRISGPDRMQILIYMEQVFDLIQRTRLYSWVNTAPTTTVTNQMAMQLRTEVVNELAISDAFLTNYARIYLSGSTLTVNESGDNVTVNFRYPRLNSSDEVLNIQIPFRGVSLPLSTFFEESFTEGISRIDIANQQESYIVRARLAAGLNNPAEVERRAAIIRSLIGEQIALDPGYLITFEDGRAQITAAQNSLIYALGISFVFMFLILAIQFNSYKIPLIIVSAIPFAITGAIFSLYIGSLLPFITSSTLSINSLLGIILLCTTAINNSIIMVDFYLNQEQITDKTEAIVYASTLRLTPILVSTLTTIFGMLPIALAFGDGSNVIQALGIVVSGGLAVS